MEVQILSSALANDGVFGNRKVGSKTPFFYRQPVRHPTCQKTGITSAVICDQKTDSLETREIRLKWGQHFLGDNDDEEVEFDTPTNRFRTETSGVWNAVRRALSQAWHQSVDLLLLEEKSS